MIDGLRQELDARGVTVAEVILPGEPADPAVVFEGALRLGSDGSGGWLLETLDYGQGYRLGRVGAWQARVGAGEDLDVQVRMRYEGDSDRPVAYDIFEKQENGRYRKAATIDNLAGTPH